MPTGDKWVQLWVAQDVSRCRGHLWACSAMQGWRTNMEVQHAVIDVFFFQILSACFSVRDGHQPYSQGFYTHKDS